jgi:hypothetical protein
LPPDGSITSSAGVPFGAEEVKETLTKPAAAVTALVSSANTVHGHISARVSINTNIFFIYKTSLSPL